MEGTELQLSGVHVQGRRRKEKEMVKAAVYSVHKPFSTWRTPRSPVSYQSCSVQTNINLI